MRIPNPSGEERLTPPKKLLLTTNAALWIVVFRPISIVSKHFGINWRVIFASRWTLVLSTATCLFLMTSVVEVGLNKHKLYREALQYAFAALPSEAFQRVSLTCDLRHDSLGGARGEAEVVATLKNGSPIPLVFNIGSGRYSITVRPLYLDLSSGTFLSDSVRSDFPAIPIFLEPGTEQSFEFTTNVSPSNMSDRRGPLALSYRWVQEGVAWGSGECVIPV